MAPRLREGLWKVLRQGVALVVHAGHADRVCVRGGRAAVAVRAALERAVEAVTAGAGVRVAGGITEIDGARVAVIAAGALPVGVLVVLGQLAGLAHAGLAEVVDRADVTILAGVAVRARRPLRGGGGGVALHAVTLRVAVRVARAADEAVARLQRVDAATVLAAVRGAGQAIVAVHGRVDADVGVGALLAGVVRAGVAVGAVGRGARDAATVDQTAGLLAVAEEPVRAVRVVDLPAALTRFRVAAVDRAVHAVGAVLGLAGLAGARAAGVVDRAHVAVLAGLAVHGGGHVVAHPLGGTEVLRARVPIVAVRGRVTRGDTAVCPDGERAHVVTTAGVRGAHRRHGLDDARLHDLTRGDGRSERVGADLRTTIGGTGVAAHLEGQLDGTGRRRRLRSGHVGHVLLGATGGEQTTHGEHATVLHQHLHEKGLLSKPRLSPRYR